MHFLRAWLKTGDFKYGNHLFCSLIGKELILHHRLALNQKVIDLGLGNGL